MQCSCNSCERYCNVPSLQKCSYVLMSWADGSVCTWLKWSQSIRQQPQSP